ncbi:MAG: alpha-L-rhamnosidase, partial [Chitinophagaceae bacterium]
MKSGNAQEASIIPQQMRCEYLDNPTGLDVLRPRLSWTLKAADSLGFGQQQTAYRILVAGTSKILKGNKGDVWDSGWINSAQMQLIDYKGKQLQSDRTYFWKVAVKDEKGKVSAWSKPAYWSTGLFNQSEWQAKWIGTAQVFDPKQSDCNVVDPWLRKVFNLKTKPARATFFVASVGYHEVYVNGKRIGNDILSPSVTDHSKRARYVAYDIAGHLMPGKNVIAIWLGTSWSIFGPYNIKDRPNTPIVIAQASINGNVIVTDESWKTHESPNKLLGVWDFGKMGGEIWDARKEIPEWNTLECNETNWKAAVVYEPNLILSAQQVEPNRLFNEITPTDIVERPDGSYRVDMGVNFAGWTSINVSGNPGDKIEFLFSERAQDDMTFSLRSAFIIGSTGKGTFKNRFNYSSARWITIKGLKNKPALSDIKGWMIRTNFANASTFECADTLQNWIYNTVKWT